MSIAEIDSTTYRKLFLDHFSRQLSRGKSNAVAYQDTQAIMDLAFTCPTLVLQYELEKDLLDGHHGLAD
jgi:hypothetical protein